MSDEERIKKAAFANLELVRSAISIANLKPKDIPMFVIYLSPKGYNVMPIGPMTNKELEHVCETFLDKEHVKVTLEFPGREN